MLKTLRKHHISFKNAFEGLSWAFRTQPNFKIHAICALIAIGVGWYVELSSLEWILLLFVIVWGISAELVNTALESVVDLITTEWRREAKIAKDVSAGAMLTVAVGAIIFAFFLLIPKLVQKLFFF